MGLMGGLAAGYLQQMPRIDARHQREIENERADIKQKMWLAQQKRQQDEYERLAKERAANRILATRPGLMKDYQDFVGPPDPQMQQVLDYASPQNIMSSENYKTDTEKMLESLKLYGAKKQLDQQFAPPPKPGTDPLSMFKAVTGRMPKDLNELSAFAQSMKGKSNQQMVYGPDGKPLYYSGPAGAEIPGGLGKRTTEKIQKEVVDNTNFISDLQSTLKEIDTKYFELPERAATMIKRGKDYMGISSPEEKEYLSNRASAMGKLASIGNAKIRQLGGTAISAEEEKRLLKELASAGDNPADFVGKFAQTMDTISRHTAILKAYLYTHKGETPTPEKVQAWGGKYIDDPSKLSVFGYTPITPQWVWENVGKGKKTVQGEQPATSSSVKPDNQARVNKWMDYANQ